MESSLTRTPGQPQLSTDEGLRRRFESKFRRNKNGCWIWTASLDKDNYGQFRVGNRVVRAHRLAYSLYTGEEIPPEMDVDHVCHIRRCVNPDHLEVVPHAENMERIRAVDDWLDDDDLSRRRTTPEEILEHVQTIVERSGVQRPSLFGNGSAKGYGVRDCGSAPWRDLAVEEGYIAQDRFALVRLFLDAVTLGVDWKVAAAKILGVSPFTVQDWLANPLWREDLDAARKAGRQCRYSALEVRHLDAMERKIDDASFADVSRSLKSLTGREKAIPEESSSGIPEITVVVGVRNPATNKYYQYTGTDLTELDERPTKTPNRFVAFEDMKPGESLSDAKKRMDNSLDLMAEVVDRRLRELEALEGPDSSRDCPTQPEFRADPDLL